MAQNAVRIQEIEGKAHQAHLDELTEIASRLSLISKLLNQSDGLDDVELGTLSRMIANETAGVFEIIEALETGTGE